MKQKKAVMKTAKDTGNQKASLTKVSTPGATKQKKAAIKTTKLATTRPGKPAVLKRPGAHEAGGSQSIDVAPKFGGIWRRSWKTRIPGWRLRGLQVDMECGMVREEWLWESQ